MRDGLAGALLPCCARLRGPCRSQGYCRRSALFPDLALRPGPKVPEISLAAVLGRPFSRRSHGPSGKDDAKVSRAGAQGSPARRTPPRSGRKKWPRSFPAGNGGPEKNEEPAKAAVLPVCSTTLERPALVGHETGI